MSRMQRPTNGDSIVPTEHFIDIEARIVKSAGNLVMVALVARDTSSGRLVNACR